MPLDYNSAQVQLVFLSSLCVHVSFLKIILAHLFPSLKFSMTSHSAGVMPCAGCLRLNAEALECRDESALRKLLSAENVEFSDTYWTSRSGTVRLVELKSNGVRIGFSVLSSRTAGDFEKKCSPHSSFD